MHSTHTMATATFDHSDYTLRLTVGRHGMPVIDSRQAWRWDVSVTEVTGATPLLTSYGGTDLDTAPGASPADALTALAGFASADAEHYEYVVMRGEHSDDRYSVARGDADAERLYGVSDDLTLFVAEREESNR